MLPYYSVTATVNSDFIDKSIAIRGVLYETLTVETSSTTPTNLTIPSVVDNNLLLLL